MTIRNAALKLINCGLSLTGMRLLGPHDAYRFDNGLPNPYELRRGLFRRMARKGFSPRYILDIGAHYATWSRDARSVWRDADFTLVEPAVAKGPILDRFVAESPSGKARWLNAGCGAENSELIFTHLPSSSDASNFHMSAEEAAVAGGVQTTVPVRTLDSLCSNGLKPDIIKIDAEGLDMAVLRGGKKAIGAAEAVFVELPMYNFFESQSFHGIISHMHEVGFEPYDITDMNRRASDEALGLIEVAFAKSNGILRDHHRW